MPVLEESEVDLFVRRLFDSWPPRRADYTVVGWTQTYKLRPTGDAHRDRLVAARLNLRSDR